MSFLRALPVFLLLLCTARAYDLLREIESDEAPKKNLSLRFYTTFKPLEDGYASNESYVFLSRNHQSRVSLDYASDAKTKIAATIERFEDDGPKRCTFQPFEDPEASYNVRLWSEKGDIEVFEIVRMYKNVKDNALDLFVVNMTNCDVGNATTLRGYDFSKYKGPYIALTPRESEYINIFSLNGKDECGSYVCQRLYFIGNKTLSQPRRFELLNDAGDWRLTFIAASSDRGFFALIRQRRTIRLLSLTPEGALINSSEEKLDSKLRFLKISTANDIFGACYVEDKSPNAAQCVQLDRKLKVKLNHTLALDDETRSMALHNLPEGGFALLTVRCAEEKKERCDNLDIKIVKHKLDGGHSELAKLKEDGCATRKRQAFHFVEVPSDKLCLFYACECAKEAAAGCDKVAIKSKCFGKEL